MIDTFLQIAKELILAAISVVFCWSISEIWLNVKSPPAEWPRKLNHVLFLSAASTSPWSIPFMFSHSYIIVSAGVLCYFVLIMSGMNIRKINRITYTDEFAIISISWLILVSQSLPWFFLISMLVWAFSDGIAALIGKSYGRYSYLIGIESKTFEGSFSFFISTFIVVQICLSLMSGISPINCILISLSMAIILTLVEGISIYGSDSLTIPITSFYLLSLITKNTTQQLAQDVFFVYSIFLLTLILNIYFGGMTAACLLFVQLYLFFVLFVLGFYWCLPLFICFIVIITSGVLNKKKCVKRKSISDISWFCAPQAAFVLLHFYIDKYVSSITGEYFDLLYLCFVILVTCQTVYEIFSKDSIA